jgi:hypothetical protein
MTQCEALFLHPTPIRIVISGTEKRIYDVLLVGTAEKNL